MPYPDVERLLVTYLGDALAVRVVTDLPANLQQVLPLVQVARIGGADDVVLDAARVDVDVFATGRGAAVELAERCRGALRFGLAGQVVDGVTVYRVRTGEGPAWRPYEDTAGVRRFGAVYEITTHYRY